MRVWSEEGVVFIQRFTADIYWTQREVQAVEHLPTDQRSRTFSDESIIKVLYQYVDSDDSTKQTLEKNKQTSSLNNAISYF